MSSESQQNAPLKNSNDKILEEWKNSFIVFMKNYKDDSNAYNEQLKNYALWFNTNYEALLPNSRQITKNIRLIMLDDLATIFTLTEYITEYNKIVDILKKEIF